MVKEIKSFLILNSKLKISHDRHLSFSAAFSIFLIVICLMFAVAICAVVFIHIDTVIHENRQDFIQQEMQGMSRELENYISLRKSALKDYANFPLVIQSVMHPKANQANIEDFMDELSLLGSKLPITLYDYSGEAIYSTNDLEGNKNVTATLPVPLSLPLISHYQFINHPDSEGSHVLLVTPVHYQHNIEGYLQAKISLFEIISDLEFSQHSKQHRIQISKEDQVLLDIGLKSNPVTDSINIESIGIKLNYNTDEKTLQRSRYNLLITLTLWLFVVSIVIVIISNKLGHVFLVSHLERLKNFAKDLADGKQITMPPAFNEFYEIKVLENHFKAMIDKVTRREKSLGDAKDTLQELNDRLVEHQQQLLHSEKLASVGQLAAGVAHEINNPTGFVMGNLEVLSEYKDDILQILALYHALEDQLNNQKSTDKTLIDIKNKKIEMNLEYTLNDMDNLISDSIEGTRRIKNIVKDLKNFSRVDNADKEYVDINQDVIETALRLVWNELKYKCTLKKSLSDLPKYLCNPGELSQVILNLLVNASDSISEQGEVSISSEFMENYIQIQVSDNGSGIKEMDLIKLFDPFFTTKEVGKGTGLGLSISHRIIEKHGGVLSVASQVDIGTVFTIMLPIDEEPQTP